MKRLLMICVLVGSFQAAFADEPALNCMNKVVAVYTPGDNWSQLQTVIPLHLQFITARLHAGDMEEAGPFLGAQGPTGGFMVYSSQDAAVVDGLVKQDPFVAQRVAKYELRTWMKCTK
jgi:uncharacterized protein YciI